MQTGRPGLVLCITIVDVQLALVCTVLAVILLLILAIRHYTTLLLAKYAFLTVLSCMSVQRTFITSFHRARCFLRTFTTIPFRCKIRLIFGKTCAFHSFLEVSGRDGLSASWKIMQTILCSVNPSHTTPCVSRTFLVQYC